MGARILDLPRSQAAEDSDQQFDSYRSVLTEVLAHHRPLTDPHGVTRCVCGAPAPCACAQLAAQLLEWV